MKKAIILGCLAIALSSPAQKIYTGKPLPSTAISEIVKDFTLKQGKHVIVDLFSSTCVVCFQSLPKLKELQQKYADKMQLVLVGIEDNNIRRTYKRFEERFSLTFPVFFDSIIDKQVGTHSFPTYLWIDSKGTVKAITNAPDFTEENINLFLQDKPIFKFLEQTIPFDFRKPYLMNGNGGWESGFLVRSLFTQWKLGDPRWFPSEIKNSDTLIQLLGVNQEQLYRYAFAGRNTWESTDSLYGFFFPLPLFNCNDSFLKAPTDGQRYCYSMLLPKPGKNGLKYLQDELNCYFPYQAQLETRLMPYWSLQLLPGIDTGKLSTRFKKPGHGLVTHSRIVVTCFPIANLIPFLSKYYPQGIPIINETGIKGNIDLKMEGVLSEFTSLRKTLQQAGMDLVEKKKPMKVIVLYKKETRE